MIDLLLTTQVYPKAFNFKPGLIVGIIDNPQKKNDWMGSAYYEDTTDAKKVYEDIKGYLTTKGYSETNSDSFVELFSMYCVIHHGREEFKFVYNPKPLVLTNYKLRSLKKNKVCVFHISNKPDNVYDTKNVFTFVNKV